MRRTWPYVVVGVVVGAVTGAAIAGLPSSDDSFSMVGAAPTVESSTLVPTTAVPPTTVPPTTVPPTTAGPAPTTVGPSTTAVSGTVPRADVRLVLANGDGRFNLAGANAKRLFAAGYVTIDLTDVSPRVPATILYYRPGFDDEARIVAADLLVPNALIEPLPDTPITINDPLGDIIVVLGPDAVR